jgi:hypothetical protein
MHSTMTWPKLTTILILSALASGCCKSGKPPTTPLVVERSRCLRHEPPPAPDPTTFSDPETELANLYARVEQLENWADAAWAACKVTP